MFQPAQRVIGINERPWARRKSYQRFLGPYLRHQQAGVYFSMEAAREQVDMVADHFLQLPRQYQHLACEYELTFSFCELPTVNGNSSTLYADFSQGNRKLASPHVEMSDASLTPKLVLPHLTHELSHLWWRNLPLEAQQQYRRFLQDSCNKDTVEITGYAQRFFDEYLDALDRQDTYAAGRQQDTLEKWAEESFCETVAALRVAGHPGRTPGTNVDIGLRRLQITSITGLNLD